MNKYFISWFFLILFFYLQAQENFQLADYLPKEESYLSTNPTPKSILRYEVGEQHVRHDQLVYYLHKLAGTSERIQIETYGETYEKRELLLLTISSPENLKRLGELQKQHLSLSNPAQSCPDLKTMPLVVYLGYSVHGNESSGSNAAMLIAYYLASSQEETVKKLLENTIILLDPCLNPDGLNRFAHWANTHRGRILVKDPNHIEHLENWPSGRTNHYWFDLNRDWLFMQHPESQGRMKKYHEWKPNIVADFHEMGTNSTYFFQPGVPNRTNPLTPNQNQTLTQEIAQYHAKALDRVGEFYFSEERFDDFYYGKGSTYPDVNGSVGILFEQASSRGHLQDSIHGVLSFPRTIRNQFITSLSTLQAGLEKRERLLGYQRTFFENAVQEAIKDPVKAYIFGGQEDQAKLYHFLEILQQNQIEVHQLANEISVQGDFFAPQNSYLVPMQQPQYRLIKALFETRTVFPSNTFYDVSTWTLPLAFALPYQKLSQDISSLLGPKLEELTFPILPKIEAEEEKIYAYLFEWKGYYAPRALNRLLKNEIKVRVATAPFQAASNQTPQQFGEGTIMVPLGIQKEKIQQIHQIIQTIAEKDAIQVYPVTTGLTPTGIDLGSPSFKPLQKVKPLLLIGGGFYSYEVGEVWHLLDYRFGMEVTIIDTKQLDGVHLADYTHLILVQNWQNDISENARNKIQQWITQGGTLVATKNSVLWAKEHFIPKVETTKESETPIETPKAQEKIPYAHFDKNEALKLISGSIFQVKLDVTHPIGYGFTQNKIPMFRNSTIFLEPVQDKYSVVAHYTDNPLLSGYISEENLQQLKNTPAIIATKVSRGVVIQIVDNPNFRAFWFGTNKLFLNSLFFSHIIRNTNSDQ